MIQNTFVIGGEPKFASKFIERLNKRLGDELQLNTISHKAWNQSGDRREEIPTGTDLVLVLKSNCNHSLRNWARKKATSDDSIKFIECTHKVAVAEFDIRHCYQLSNFESVDETQEEQDLYESWREALGEHHYVLPLWGEEDEGVFEGKDAYERMPWNREGKKKMILKWDKIWVSYAKSISPEIYRAVIATRHTGRKDAFKPLYSVNNGKSPYYKLIGHFKSLSEDSIGHTQVKLWADQWVKDAYLGSNFKDFSGKKNIDYALQTVFGVGIDDLTLESQEVINDHYKVKRKVKHKTEPQTRPEILTQEAWDGYVANNPLPPQEDEQLEAPQPIIAPVLEEVPTPQLTVDDYVMLGDLKITPNDTTIKLNEVHLSMKEVHAQGDVSISIQRITNNTLYGVEIKKKG